MVDTPLSIVIIVGAGFVLLRPADFPLFARNAGRVVGLTVRGLRQAKDFADDVIERSTKESGNNPKVAALRTQVQSSLDQLSDLASTVRRDVSDVPLSPASFIRTRFRSVAFQPQQQQRQRQPQQEQQKEVNQSLRAKDQGMNSHSNQAQVSNSSPFSTEPWESTASTSRGSGTRVSQLENISSSSSTCTGADFISRSIEEAALASQYRKWFPSGSDKTYQRTLDEKV